MSDCYYVNCNEKLISTEINIYNCNDCNSVKYCSKKCLILDRENHKLECNKNEKKSAQTSLKSPYIKILEEYEFLNNEEGKEILLGNGKFGQIKLVKHIQTYAIYTLKTVKKDSLRTENDFNNVKKEIKMLKMINHPNILRLIKSCEDKENVYIIMEYASNHSVWNYIQKKKRLSEINAFVLFIQVCLALDYIHKLGFIHRNINSKTLWIDSNGHLKLGDLAWCGKLEELRNTYCGNLDYMAPEILKQEEQTEKTDVWCLGVLLYEMIVGEIPYDTKDLKCKLDQKIDIHLEIPKDIMISEELKSLIFLILKEDPKKRPNLKEIFLNPWILENSKKRDIDIPKYLQLSVAETLPLVNSREDKFKIAKFESQILREEVSEKKIGNSQAFKNKIKELKNKLENFENLEKKLSDERISSVLKKNIDELIINEQNLISEPKEEKSIIKKSDSIKQENDKFPLSLFKKVKVISDVSNFFLKSQHKKDLIQINSEDLNENTSNFENNNEISKNKRYSSTFQKKSLIDFETNLETKNSLILGENYIESFKKAQNLEMRGTKNNKESIEQILNINSSPISQTSPLVYKTEIGKIFESFKIPSLKISDFNEKYNNRVKSENDQTTINNKIKSNENINFKIVPKKENVIEKEITKNNEKIEMTRLNLEKKIEKNKKNKFSKEINDTTQNKNINLPQKYPISEKVSKKNMDVIKELQEHEEKETLKKKKSKLNHIPKKSKKKIKEIIEEKIKHNEKISSKLINSLDEWKPPKEPKKDQKVSEGWFAKSYINKKYEELNIFEKIALSLGCATQLK